MIKHLLIKNYALIQHLEIQPDRHFNVITGETGAGKSIILGAIGLLLGERADRKAILTENEKTIIEGTFEVQPKLSKWFEDQELDFDNECILRREFSPSGKSRAFINDTPVSLDVIKKLSGQLIDIHSQHDTLNLASGEFQLQFVDSIAELEGELKTYQNTYINLKNNTKELEKLKNEAAALKKEQDYHQFLYQELEEADFQEGEQEKLESDLKIAQHAEDIKANFAQVFELLDGGEVNINSSLHSCLHHLEKVNEVTTNYKELKDRLEQAAIELKELAPEIYQAGEQIEWDEQQNLLMQERLDMLYKLQQKHQVQTIGELIKIQHELADKLAHHTEVDGNIIRLEQQKEALHQQAQALANKLSDKRIAAFEQLERKLLPLLQSLGMPHARAKLTREEIPLGITGTDEIQLLFSANKGIDPAPIRNVASGGEFSRLMFCLKYLLAGKVTLPTLIFDEIDTGISGEIAQMMAKNMKSLAKQHQLIVISHLPQIAAKADAHYLVYKDDTGEVTKSNMKHLEENDRLLQIAKMITGEDVSDHAMAHAKELMEG